MKGLLKIGFVLCLCLLTGCANYYYQGGQKKVTSDQNDRFNKFQLTFDEGKQKLDFYTYGDYVFNRVEKEYIFFKNSDMKRMLHYKNPKKHTEQFLFMYTNQPTFANILGFYYKGMTIEEIKENYSTVSYKQTEDQLLSRYTFDKFQVFDFYKNVDGGVVRFISLNNPEAKDVDYKNFEREIRTIFFEANSIMNTSAVTKKNQELTWYDAIIVQTIDADPDNSEQYRVALGLSAQVFYLSSETENFAQLFKELSESYREQKTVKIGVENGTNQIRKVTLIVEK